MRILREVKKLKEFEGCEITFRGGGAEDQPMISRMIEELNKEGIKAQREPDKISQDGDPDDS